MKTLLFIQLRGLQYHLNIIEGQQTLINKKWKNLHIIEWKVKEQLHEPLQKDR
jgi:hypothetical protein